MLHFGERKKIVDIPNGIEHNLTKRWLDWIPNYPERIYRNKTKISHPYWQNINWGTSWCQNPSVKLLRQPVTHVIWIQYAKGWHIISQCERREGLQQQNMWEEEALLTARRETSSFWSFFSHEACAKEICCCTIHFSNTNFSYKWQMLGPSSTLRLVWKRWGGAGGPEGNYLDWREKLGSSWIETRKRAPRLKTSCSHRQSRHIRRDRVARFKPRADDTMSPEGHFHIYEFSDQRVWEIYDQCLLLLKKRLTKVTRPTVNLNHLPFQVNEWGPFKHCSFHAMPCVDVKTKWCLRGTHQY